MPSQLLEQYFPVAKDFAIRDSNQRDAGLFARSRPRRVHAALFRIVVIFAVDLHTPD